MAIYKFRVILEDEDNVYRDVEIRSTSTVLELYQSFLNAFSFTDEPEAQFFYSDNNWHEAEQIHKIPSGQINLKQHAILNKVVSTFINDPHQRFIFRINTYRNFTWFVELVKINTDDAKAFLPRVTKSVGEPPRPPKTLAEIGYVDPEEETPKKRGRKPTGLEESLLAEAMLIADEPDSSDLESEEIESFIQSAEAEDITEIDPEFADTSSSEEFSTNDFDEFGDTDDENSNDGDFDFDSLSSGNDEY